MFRIKCLPGILAAHPAWKDAGQDLKIDNHYCLLSVLLRFTDSDYPFGIFKLFFLANVTHNKRAISLAMWVIFQIKVITKLPNSEQSYKGKVKTHNYINRQNQSTTENCENRNDPDLVQAFPKKWWVESDFKAPNLPLSLRFKGSGCHCNSI